MPDKQPAVYIITNKRNGVLYTGVTGDLPARIWRHKNGETGGFARKYGLNMLVYYELHGGMSGAIVREKQIKNWRRAWKIQLIEKANPYWRDLYADIL